MPQIFPAKANTYARLSILAGLLVGGGVLGSILAIERSPYTTNENVVYPQPVPFSHDHHTKALGIDCRYCHTTVEKAAFANIPATEVCMNCHKLIWKDSPMLEPVRASLRDNEPIRWNRVHDLPDFVHFDHSIHVSKGVACVQCHGEVTEMPLIKRGSSLQMRWCLDCHRHPDPNLRPPSEIFNSDWNSGDGPAGDELRKTANIEDEWRLTSCSTCHH